MKGEYAFCPKTGASLSERPHYDERGHPWRVPEFDETTASLNAEQELTNGRLQSARIALFNYFRRCHGYDHDPDAELYRSAANDLRRIKRAATGQSAWDFVVWYCLGERLARLDFDVDWMHGYVKPRCLSCGGPLKYDRDSDRPAGTCATNCTGDRRDQLLVLRQQITQLFAAAFDSTRSLQQDELVLFE